MNHTDLNRESALEWLDYARKDLALARLGEERKEDLSHQVCFLAQQAAEKAVKAVFIFRGISFPFVHDMGVLLKIAEEEKIDVPSPVIDAEELTPYAVEARYPGMNGPVLPEEVVRALKIAENVIAWVEELIGERGDISAL